MFVWLSQNWGSILVLLAVALLVFFCIRSLRKQRKTPGCTGGCAGCPMSSSCHAARETRPGK